jgi:hypothetical protein
MDQNNNGIRLIVLGADRRLMALTFVASLVLGNDDVMGDGPRIVVVNRAGGEFIVQQFKSLKKAEQALGPMRSELDRLGVDAWCEAHNVPPDFESWSRKSVE